MDASHYFTGDLGLGATGDLLVAGGLVESEQRVLRRLLTNPGDYPWQLRYGAGLPSYIGATLDAAAMTSLTTSQMYLEPGVAHNPQPAIALQAVPGGIATQITYTEAESGASVPLDFSVTP